MQHYADEMEFEKAAEMRDRILLLKDMELGLKPPSRALLAAPVKKETHGRDCRGARRAAAARQRASRPRKR